MPWSKTKTTSLVSCVLSLAVLPWRNPGYPLLLLLLLLLARFPLLLCPGASVSWLFSAPAPVLGSAEMAGSESAVRAVRCVGKRWDVDAMRCVAEGVDMYRALGSWVRVVAWGLGASANRGPEGCCTRHKREDGGIQRLTSSRSARGAAAITIRMAGPRERLARLARDCVRGLLTYLHHLYWHWLVRASKEFPNTTLVVRHVKLRITKCKSIV
jgi:hypothetical protein